MKLRGSAAFLTIAFVAAAIARPTYAAKPHKKNPATGDPVDQIVRAINAKNIERTIRTLVSFGTRSTLSSQDDPKRGIDAARDWLFGQFQEIAKESDGRMTVELQSYEQEPGRYPRVATATRITNVVATLHGADPESAKRIYVVSGHYDSMCTSPTDAQCDAPGADDDASGVATALETARVMARHHFNATIVFMAVAGEEQGLVGSTYYAEQAKKNGMDIDAMFTNDIVGNTLGGNGMRDRKTVRVFSEGVPSNETEDEGRTRRSVGGENDSASRELARYIVQCANRSMPDFKVWMIYRRDRYLRGGDHIPFVERGYPAVRFTEPNEDYNHQHQNVRLENSVEYGDLPKFVDFKYVAAVTGVNVTALASLALAPARPHDVQILTNRLTNDTDLQWSPNSEPYFDHYEIVWRDTAAPMWQHSRAVGNANKYTVKGLSKDNFIFGVCACGKEGHCSPATFPRPHRDRDAFGRAIGSNATLRDELRALAVADQEVRNRWIADQKNEAIRSEMIELDAKHVARLREIVKEYGWPTKSLVGDNGSGDAWLIAQHGGKEVLHEMLPLMKEAVDKHELDASNYAVSVDRVRIKDGQLQLYGSQFSKGEKCEPQPIEDPEHVDERRKTMGLDPLAEYAKKLCAMYGKKQ
jgi:hypothetical protein